MANHFFLALKRSMAFLFHLFPNMKTYNTIVRSSLVSNKAIYKTSSVAYMGQGQLDHLSVEKIKWDQPTMDGWMDG